MAGKTYKTRGIVLRKTKLAEKDLIVAILDETGSLVRAVAKGARKPGGSYAARIELFSVVDLVLAEGRNLDVITSATLVPRREHGPLEMEQSVCASVLAELLGTLAQEDLPHERLYAMSEMAFTCMHVSDSLQSLALLCSSSLKALAYAGFRPSLTTCVQCGSPVDLLAREQTVAFSYSEGGVACDSCRQLSDSVVVETAFLSWVEALMLSKFEDVLSFEVDAGTLLTVVQFIKQWTRVHAGKTLKSADFILTCGLF